MFLTEAASVVGWTVTEEVIDAIKTTAPMVAWGAMALIDIHFTMYT